MSQTEPRWVPRIVIEAVHLDQVREHGGLIGVRDENALESALARARQRWTYKPEVDVAELAACYAFGLSSNHPFRDGNKRIAFLAAVILLGLNGFDLLTTDDDVLETVLKLASGSLSEDELAVWIRAQTRPRST